MCARRRWSRTAETNHAAILSIAAADSTAHQIVTAFTCTRKRTQSAFPRRSPLPSGEGLGVRALPPQQNRMTLYGVGSLAASTQNCNGSLLQCDYRKSTHTFAHTFS